MNIFNTTEFGRLLMVLVDSECCLRLEVAVVPDIKPLVLKHFGDVQLLANSLNFEDLRDAAGLQAQMSK